MDLKNTEEAYFGVENEIEVEVLSPDKVQALFIWSFFFSQGEPEVQNLIFRWLHGAYPAYRIDVANGKEFAQNCARSITKMLSKTRPSTAHAPEPEGEIAREATRMLGTFKDEMAKAPTEDVSTLEQELLSQMINRDYEYLVNKGKRERVKYAGAEGKLPPIFDPFLSQVYYFIIEGHATPVPEYTELMRKLKPYAEALEQGAKKDSFESLTARTALLKIKEVYSTNKQAASEPLAAA